MMSELEANLNQVLRALDHLGPRELAVIEERLAARKHSVDQPPEAAADLFELPFDEYLAMSDEERDAVALRAYQILDAWINAELKKRKAEWILVCGGQVIESSSTLRDYPSDEKLMQVGRQRGLVPFVFVKGPLIEESSWSAIEENDFYPTINLTLAAHDASAERLSTEGIEITADFDTGSPSFLIDYDQMLAHRVIQPGPIKQAHYKSHLGQVYRFHFRPLLVGIHDEAGSIAIRNFTAICIRDWRQSPLCLVNSDREALAGRNLLTEFPLRLELDGARRVTRLLPT
jgi:hypothetical protein